MRLLSNLRHNTNQVNYFVMYAQTFIQEIFLSILHHALKIRDKCWPD